MPKVKTRFWMVACAWLVLITVLAATGSFSGPLPLDARTNLPVQVITTHFDWPAAAIAIEPLTAPAAIIVCAPNYIVAGLAVFFWLAAVVAIGRGYQLLRQRGKPIYSMLGKACGAASAALLIAALYVAFVILVPLPSWRLTVSDPEIVVADLHSHTLLSYDAFASCRSNIAYHRARGYNFIAVTEHPSEPELVLPSPCANAEFKLPQVITGIEVEAGGYRLLALGIPPDFPPFRLFERSEQDWNALSALIEAVHAAGGAVTALSFNLANNDLQRFVDAGVDGFEIANFGHPTLPAALKAALLALQRSHHTALIAVSDWHGWGGFARTWTLFRPRSPQSVPRPAQVLGVLRAHDVDAVTPVIYHPFGQPTLLAGAVAPWIEIFNYARELTPMRVASWWLWTCMVAAMALWLGGRGFKPTPCIAGGAMLLLATGFLVRGAVLVADWKSGTPYWFTFKIAIFCFGLSAVSLCVAVVLLAKRRSEPDITKAASASHRPRLVE